MGYQRGRGLEVGLLQAVDGAEVVRLGEVEAAEVVEEGDALSGGVEGQRGGDGIDIDKDHFCEMCSPALGKHKKPYGPSR